MRGQRAIWDERYQRIDHTDMNLSWIAQYDRYFDAAAGQKVLDLGCGTGEQAVYLMRRGLSVIACDFSQTAIDHLSAIAPTIETRVFDMTAGLPFEAGSLGIVLASLSTHYFSLAETRALYKDIRRVLAENGHFIFRVNSAAEKINKDAPRVVAEIEPGYYQLANGCVKRYFEPEDLRALLDGFDIVELSERCERCYQSDKYFIQCVAKKRGGEK